MPVSTDGVILGAWAPLTQASKILDIGAGSGLLSLMAAQRADSEITAVEIDPVAAQVCQRNFDASPWRARVQLIAADVEKFAEQQLDKFDHIICNPPYFDTGPRSDKAGRATARHTGQLDFCTLAQVFDKLLAQDGQISMILPRESLSVWINAMQPTSLRIWHRCEVISVRDKVAKRVLLLLGRGMVEEGHSQLVIRERDNSYSTEMTALTRDFYLFM